MKNIFTLITILLFINGFVVDAQQVISNMGNTLQTSAGSISYTLGEPVITTLSTPGGIITQGFHQTKLTVTAVEDYYGNSMSVRVYPNPTAEILHISLDFNEISNIRLIIYDQIGRIHTALNADRELMEVNISGYIPGIYILKIHKGSIAVGVYKIVKTE